MKVATYYRNHDIRLEEVPVPTIGDEEVLIKVEASGICGSDVMEWYRIEKAPRVLGHEVAGTIEAVGKDITDWKVGQRVVATHHVPCEECRYCDHGHESVCDTLRNTNFDPGGFAEYVRMPDINVEKGLIELPENISFVQGTFAEPLGCVVRGQNFAQMIPEALDGRSVLIIGSGIAGMLHLKLAIAKGAERVFTTDIEPFRIGLGMTAGATACFDGREPFEDQLLEMNDGRGVDFVVVCAGAKTAVQQAFDLVDKGGTILLFAPTKPGVTVGVDLWDLWVNEVTLTTSYAASKKDLVKAVDLISSGLVTVDDMVTHQLPLEEAGKGFELAAEGKESLKVVIEP